MARLHSSGFELNSNTTGVEFDTCNGTGATVNSTTKRSGSYAGKILTPQTGVRTGWALRFASAAQDDVYFRAYLYVVTSPNVNNTILCLHDTTSLSTDSSPQCRLRLHTDRSLHVIDELGVDRANAALSANTWYRIEARFESAGGGGTNILRVKVDGTDVLNSTTESHSTNPTTLRIGANMEGQTCTTGEWYFDDVAVNDEVGAAQATFPGDGSIVHLYPDSAGDFAEGLQGGASGSATAWQNVDEFPPNDVTDYWALQVDSAGSTSADRLDVGVQDFTPSSSSITLVQLGVRMIPASNAACSFVLRCKSQASGTLAESATVAITGTAWATNDDTATTRAPKLIRYTDPQDSAAWTVTDLNGMQIGVRAPDATPDVWVTALWALVEYVASAGGGAAVYNPYFYRFIGGH